MHTFLIISNIGGIVINGTIHLTAKETTVEEGGQIGGQKVAVIDDIKELTHRQKEVLKLIALDNRISRSGIAEVLHINESAIQKHLNNLKDTGFIERVGGTRGYWKINLDKN
ncbi:winged helix-turn-helix transcriptional regulator [Salegentibacter sp. F188]|uniref:Winged helix-turn-helix transcriptional regulator n=1 Tax=Autumnicola patrickiae TaxID=3075591 RepID=A0ABU3E5W1_9FLAO|nr:winged helix-turn-helix transcriptional regulator [Salegentibacter sp. F188]MDT0691385.1 winged helix-turn-helix transcriptional regulator [Salegentibacter sp. F188]